MADDPDPAALVRAARIIADCGYCKGAGLPEGWRFNYVGD